MSQKGLPSVLPGRTAASPLFEQKSTAIWRQLTAISNFSQIPLLFSYFWSFHTGKHIKISLKCNSFSMFFSQNSIKIKFRYFPATFGQNK
jgi:hypothetical protein